MFRKIKHRNLYSFKNSGCIFLIEVKKKIFKCVFLKNAIVMNHELRKMFYLKKNSSDIYIKCKACILCDAKRDLSIGLNISEYPEILRLLFL